MTKQQMLEKIYEVMGDKELTFGCKMSYEKEWGKDILTFCSIYDDTGMTKTLSFLPEDKEMTYDDNPEVEKVCKKLKIPFTLVTF